MKNEPCIIFGLNFEHKSTNHIFRAGSLCHVDFFFSYSSHKHRKTIKSFSRREECTIFLLKFKSCRTGRPDWSHLACGVKDRSFEMSFFRCLSPHSSTCPLVPGTHLIHYLQSVANSCDEDFPAHIPRARPLHSL